MVQIKNHRNVELKKYMNFKFTQKKRQILADKKRIKKHADLRKYAKLCKQEGIISDRVNLNSSENGIGNVSQENGINSDKTSKVNEKMKPFAKALETANKRKEEAELIKQAAANKKEEIQKAKKIRDEKRKMHMKRTKKGQPLLNDQIKGILTKLKAGS